MKKILKLSISIIVLMLFFFIENNSAQQNEYISGLDSNQIITVSNYAPKLNEIVTIKVKYYHPKKYIKMEGFSGYPLYIDLLYDKKLEKDKSFTIISFDKKRSNDKNGSFDSLMLAVKFNIKGIYNFHSYISADYISLRIPIYVEGRLPQSDPLKKIKDRLKKLKENIEKLETMPAKGKMHLVNNYGLEYSKPVYSPKTDYEMSIYKDIIDNNKLKYEEYKKEFDRLYAIQNNIYIERRKNNKVK